MSTPQHRDRRNWRTERTPRVGRFLGPGGVLTLTTYDEQSVVDQFCAHCGQWIEVRGVSGGIRFLASHAAGDCKKETEEQ